MKPKPKRISGIIASSLTLAFSLFGAPKITAQEIKPISIEHILDNANSTTAHNPKVDLIFNYGLESKAEALGYLKGFTYFGGETLVRDANVPEINLEETSQIESLIKGIKSNNVNSYPELVELSKNLSESQKIVLFASLSQLLYAGSYIDNSPLNKVESQEIFFKNLQNFLSTHNQSPLGVCPQFPTYIERLANDTGIKTTAVTGTREDRGHVSDILKLKEGIGIVDGGIILIAKTKNIEKILSAYQKSVDSSVFQHLFFEDNKFRYMLISKDGRNFLNFVEYDASSNPIKNSGD